MPTPYKKVDSRASFPEVETAVAERWKRDRIFHTSMEQRKGAPEWVFYEGPPTANNKPGIHHVEARTFKDIFCRFQTMRGRYVHRKGGWDCHGLPVEIEVEKELGITQKHEIEDRVRDRRLRGALPRLRPEVRGRLGADDRADRVLGRSRRGLLDDDARLRRERLVDPQADLGQGPAGGGLQGRPLLPALRDLAVVARATPDRRVQGRDRSVGLRPLPTGRRPQDGSARVDDDPVDAPVEHGDRGQPERDLRKGRRSSRSATTSSSSWSNASRH